MKDDDKIRIYSIPRTNEVISRDDDSVRQLKDIKLNDACCICGKKELLPFKCSYCGRVFCSDHRMPEAHACTYHIEVDEIHSETIRTDGGEIISNVFDMKTLSASVFEPALDDDADKKAKEYNRIHGFGEVADNAIKSMRSPQPVNPYRLNYHKGPLHPEDAKSPGEGAEGVKMLFKDEREERGFIAWIKKHFKLGWH